MVFFIWEAKIVNGRHLCKWLSSKQMILAETVLALHLCLASGLANVPSRLDSVVPFWCLRYVRGSAGETGLVTWHAYGKKSTAFIQQCTRDILCILSSVSTPFVPYTLLESTTGNTCVSDAVGYLLIMTVGSGETATKIKKSTLLRTLPSVCLLLIPFSDWNITSVSLIFIASPKRLVATDSESVNLYRSSSKWAPIASAYRSQNKWVSDSSSPSGVVYWRYLHLSCLWSGCLDLSL